MKSPLLTLLCKTMDPFEQTINQCIPINSDNVELQNCPFTYDYENSSPDSSPSESQPTGIFMLSLPSTTDSFTQYSPNEHFETPPEHNNSSQPYFSGSDDPKLNGDIDADVDNSSTVVAVDLANDSDELGFEEKMGEEVRVSDEGLGEKERVAIEISQTQEVDTEVVVMDCEENLEADEGGVERNEDDLAGKVCESGGEEGDDDKFKDVVVDDGASGGASKELDENEKLDAVGVQSQGVTEGVGGGEGRRELPASMRGGERRNVGLTEEVGSSERVMTGRFKDLMEAVSKVIGNASSGDKSGDFFETAQRRGMTLRRPRWWPPEGFGN